MIEDDSWISKEEALFICKRWIISLYKQYLISLEDLKKEHDINFNKLISSFSKEKNLINMANYFDEEHFKNKRKRVLDLGNEAIRNLERDINNL